MLPSVRNAATALALICIVASVAWWTLFKSGVVTLYLVPGAVLHSGEVWQLATWMFPAIDVTPVLFSALIIWQCGGYLESWWGRRRFLTFTLVTTFVSGLLTVGVVALLATFGINIMGALYTGGTVMGSMLWVAQGLAIWNGQTNLFGYPMTGRTFAAIGVLLTALTGVFAGVAILIPEIFALVIAFLYVRQGFPSNLLERLGSWRLQRRLAKRTSQLRVVSDGQRNTSSGSDKFLH